MKRKSRYHWILRVIGFALLPVLTGFPAGAATHVVTFGGSAGSKYVPASFIASVGDTVMWQGSFSAHPLSSTSIPSGAQGWHKGSGTTFNYVITVQGVFNYKCDLHSGMTGSFNVGVTGVDSASLGSELERKVAGQVRFLMVNEAPSVQLTVLRAGLIALRVTDLLGRVQKVATIKAGQHGTYTLPIGNMAANGTFIAEVSFDGRKLSRVITLTNP